MFFMSWFAADRSERGRTSGRARAGTGGRVRVDGRARADVCARVGGRALARVRVGGRTRADTCGLCKTDARRCCDVTSQISKLGRLVVFTPSQKLVTKCAIAADAR